jgi:hypothetical protein
MRPAPALRSLALGVLVLATVPPAALARPALTGFLSKPTDQLAVPGMAGTGELTPEGDLYTGFAEYRIRFGSRLRSWDQPTRTLADPAIPSYSGALLNGPVRYTQSDFAVPHAGEPVVYQTVTMSNPSGQTRLAQVEMSVAYTAGSPIKSSDGGLATPFRFQRPALGGPLGAYYQPGQQFSTSFSYTFQGRDLDRSGLLLARGPAASSQAIRDAPLDTPTASHDSRLFVLRLPPHGQASLTWQIPLTPPPAGAPSDRALTRMPVAQAAVALRKLWGTQEAGMMRISVPEPKVSATYEASITEILDSRLLTGAGFEQTPNRLQYQAFWVRDAAIETQALDLAGLHGPAAQNLAFMDAFQGQDGLFLSQPEQYDALGQALWAISQHAELTRDPAYAASQLPRIQAAVGWLSTVSESDPLGLLPAASPNDNELASGHITGDDLWAAVGLRAAVADAKLAGREDLAMQWQALDERFEASLERAIATAVAREGHIPPVLDASDGQDWGNYWAAFPAQILPAGSAAVQATIAWAKAHMDQGLPTYADGKDLHDYLGFRIFETELEAGEVEGALDGFYAELDHTTSTDGGWETIPAPFTGRASTTNLAPHGDFAAEYIALLRNMLLREAQPGEIVLLAGASPAWLGQGQHITVLSAPTAQGAISFTERSSATSEMLTWRDDFAAGTRLRWELPSWARSARLPDGTPTGESVALDGDSGSLTVNLSGTRPGQSYAQAVAALDAEYRAHRRPAPLVPTI